MTSRIVAHTHPFFSALVPHGNRKEINVVSGTSCAVSAERSGGSYSEYRRVRLDAPRDYLPVNSGSGFPSFQRGENEVLPGECFIETGMFLGKPMRPRIILHPDDFARLCPPKCTIHQDCQNTEGLAILCAKTTPTPFSARLQKVLGCYTMTGNYRKEALSRMNATEEEKDTLLTLGFLIRKGSGIGLSTEGKNQARGY